MKSIVVFCGSSAGSHPAYEEQAYRLGGILAERDIRLVYGGAKVGLMGAVANGCLDKGGAVTGVLPRFLQTKEVAHEALTELILVDTMHERKLKMHELSEGIITLPGGFGTMEEMFEMLTWAQLGLHGKPIGILNIQGYYDALRQLNHTMVQEGFLKASHSDMLLYDDTIEGLLAQMMTYEAPEAPKWITRQTT